MRSENIQKWVSVSWCPYNQSYGFSSSHIWMWELDHKEVWMLKNWCFRIMVLEKTLQSPLDCKEIKPVNPKGNQPWIFIARMNAEAPILWSPDAKSWLIWKDSDAGKDWRQKEKGEPSMRWLDSIADSMDISSVQFNSVAQSCLTLCNSIGCSTSGFPVHFTSSQSLFKFSGHESEETLGGSGGQRSLVCCSS